MGNVQQTRNPAYQVFLMRIGPAVDPGYAPEHPDQLCHAQFRRGNPENLDDLIKVEPDHAQEFVGKQAATRPSWLRVRVSDMKTGKNKVTVNVPMRLVRFGLSVGSRFAPELEGLDWNEIDSYLSVEKGMLVDVQDEEDGEHVQIFVD